MIICWFKNKARINLDQFRFCCYPVCITVTWQEADWLSVTDVLHGISIEPHYKATMKIPVQVDTCTNHILLSQSRSRNCRRCSCNANPEQQQQQQQQQKQQQQNAHQADGDFPSPLCRHLKEAAGVVISKATMPLMVPRTPSSVNESGQRIAAVERRTNLFDLKGRVVTKYPGK